ncbi:putative beta-lysine N-acetyltransferase [Plebeiibacterium marinum]|uniref:Beta-lysine N-acetyltransferase n=1 Tax=Plebeiibacterium marinum TaxID=2992111 RepID=A0AAE3MDW8_9BACT|nr:putative beta-lysine N-acetyltransferase [Plebeiobacterium marinum]MCW3806148.1 putative beta-lysine N-acetyltransferase [Plebeiobacterium marinum]
MCDILTINDTVETIGSGTCIQHGKHNDRIYLMKLDQRDMPEVFNMLTELAVKEKYSKIICKVPKNYAPAFYANGYILEAFIPEFYDAEQDVFFLSKYLNSDRFLDIERSQLSKFSSILNKESGKKVADHPDFTVRELTENDISDIIDIYKEVFETYPFPIHDDDYILQTMDENVRYFGAEKNGKLAAIASAEMDIKSGNAEMTDFATYPGFSGNRLATALLKKLEEEMKEDGIQTLYTIARLNSIPMNLTFIHMDYTYSGTLIKNTNISGDIESMNVYYKHI